MRIKKRNKPEVQKYLIVFITSIIIAIIVLGQFFLNHYINDHAMEDLYTSSATQAQILDEQIHEEAEKLGLLAASFESESDFLSAENRKSLEDYVKYNRLCMLAFADEDGNAYSYKGEAMGNISDRNYFLNIITGRSTHECAYLPNPQGCDSPRSLVAVPVYSDGNISGVLFMSEDIETLKDNLFSQAFKVNADIILYDLKSNSVICRMNNTLSEDGTVIKAEIENTILSRYIEKNGGLEAGISAFQLAGRRYYCSVVPVCDDEDWQLVCVTDHGVAADVYGGTLSDIIHFVYLVLAAFVCVSTFCIYLITEQIRKRREEEKQYQFRITTYRQMLEQMNSAVVEYDIINDQLTSSESFARVFKSEGISGSLNILKELQKDHQEFGFAELYAEIQLIVNTGKPSSFETILNLDDGSTIWINIVLLPIPDASGEITRIFAAVQDVTMQHKDFETAVSMMNQLPGGVHRCYLSDPIHLEYASEGLLRMLGYSEEEFAELIGPDQNFCNCIAEEDQQLFENFVTELSKNGGSAVCTYRLIDKSGNEIYVSDTMDAKRAASGIMYGYSVVTDMRNYKEREQTMQKELDAANKALEQARIRVSTGQMQPHFLYNVLASIREIILEDPQYASDLLCDFTVHLRACIRSLSNDNFIPFSQELDNIKAYVNIEHMRFGERLNIAYDIETEDFNIVPLSVQPLVENAIRHGIYERGAKGGHVILSTRQNGSSILVTIKDDGVGFDYEKIKQEIKEGARDSTGLVNLIYRFRELMNAEVCIESTIGEGTTVTITIPKEVIN